MQYFIHGKNYLLIMSLIIDFFAFKCLGSEKLINKYNVITQQH